MNPLVAVAIGLLFGVWAFVGLVLSIDGTRAAIPRIRERDGWVNWPIVAVVFVLGIVWLPARFFWALARGR